MDEAAVSGYIRDTFADVDVTEAMNASFFFHNPPGVPPDQRFPFATIVTTDEHDAGAVSDLARPDVFRLNVGVSKETFRALFTADTEYDYTALDRVMPHPVYGKMYWVCVLNPSEGTFASAVRPLLAEAYEMAAGRRRPAST